MAFQLLGRTFLIAGSLMLFLTGCVSLHGATSQDPIAASNIKPLDYSEASQWMYAKGNPQHDVDLLYIYQTATAEPTESEFSLLTEADKKEAQNAFKRAARCFSGYTNVYVPYYRQATFQKVMSLPDIEALEQYIQSSEAGADINAALDFYFENLNGARPFILASHSQGSVISRIVLSQYVNNPRLKSQALS